MTLSVVVISGWAMPVSVLQPLLDAFDDNVLVKGVSLPGVSNPIQDNHWNPSEEHQDHSSITWPVLMDYLDHHLPENPVILVGWSFGGTLAVQYAACHPEKVAAVVSMATNPSFIQQTQWPCAMDPAVFTHFCEQFVQNTSLTLKRFARMCSEGSQHPLQMASLLRQAWQPSHLDKTQLDNLQRFLGMADITASLARLHCPVSHLLGCDDALVPAETGELIKQHYPEHRVLLTRGGHTFCIENPQWTANQVLSLCSR